MKRKEEITNPLEVERALKDIGKKVRKLRKRINNNYEDFARDHNINKVTLSRLENGDNSTLSSLIQVLQALNISLEDFFTDTNIKS